MATTSAACHQSGFIITRLDDGSYAYTLSSHGVEFAPDQLQELFRFFGVPNPPSIDEIDEEIAREGHSVVGSPTVLNAEETAACIS